MFHQVNSISQILGMEFSFTVQEIYNDSKKIPKLESISLIFVL